jgi:endonuclease YncB( thermonuclease family)
MRLIIAAALVAACCPASASEMLPGPYPAEIVRVIDGDTVEARVHVWLGLDQTTRIRLRGIDAPELHGQCPGEREAAAAARDHLIRLLAAGPVTVTDISIDKYGGRVDARIRLPDGADVSAAMIKAGQALPTVRSRVPRC